MKTCQVLSIIWAQGINKQCKINTKVTKSWLIQSLKSDYKVQESANKCEKENKNKKSR